MSYTTITHEEDIDLIYTVDTSHQLDMGHTESEMAWVKDEKCYYVFDGNNWTPLVPKHIDTITMGDVNTEIEVLVQEMDQLESKLLISVDNVIRTENQRFIDQHKVNDTIEQSFGVLGENMTHIGMDLTQVKLDLSTIDAVLDNQGGAIAHSQRVNTEIKLRVNDVLEHNDKLLEQLTKIESVIEALKNKSTNNKILWLAISSVALIEVVQIIVSII